jgi:hypothetical protein
LIKKREKYLPFRSAALTVLTGMQVESLFRNEKEVLSDNLLLIYLASKLQKADSSIDKIKDLVFLVEALSSKQGVRTFNYEFYSGREGINSQGLSIDIDNLISEHIIIPATSRLTQHGEDVLKQCVELFAENKNVVKTVDIIVNEYEKMTLDELNTQIYKGTLRENETIIPLEKIREGENVFSPLPESQAKFKFEISDSWEATLDILLDKQFYDEFCEALKDAKTDRVYSLN